MEESDDSSDVSLPQLGADDGLNILNDQTDDAPQKEFIYDSTKDDDDDEINNNEESQQYFNDDEENNENKEESEHQSLSDNEDNDNHEVSDNNEDDKDVNNDKEEDDNEENEKQFVNDESDDDESDEEMTEKKSIELKNDDNAEDVDDGDVSPKNDFDTSEGAHDKSDDANEENITAEEEQQSEANLDSSQLDTGPAVGELIADIFGDSDDSEAEFEGFEAKKSQSLKIDDEDDDDEKPAKDHESQDVDPSDNNIVPDVSSDEDSDAEDARKRKSLPEDFVYDFDLMLQRKKEESYRRRKRKNIDIINDNDDVIADIIREMKLAADEDFERNKNRQAATSKLKMLPIVVTQLRKLDLREAFLDAGVLGVITDWLTPLPDRSLPHLQIRENMLKILGEFNIDDVERIKASGIGKAVMYLLKNPKETKENKRHAGHLIASWSRPIFNLDTDFHSMSKEEREQRDFEHMKKAKRMRTESQSETEVTPNRPKSTEEKNLRPGDKGWVPRARVPMPSMRDYVVRPKSSVDIDIHRGSGSKRSVTRLDKHLRNFREKKKLTKAQRAVPISIEGRKMAL